MPRRNFSRMSDAPQTTLSLPDLPGIGVGWELLLPARERARRCTGTTAAKLEEKREGIVAACAVVGTRRAAEAFGVSREVVRALRSEAIRSGKLDQIKEETGRRALAAADRVMDRIEDEVDQLPRAGLALTYAILQDKGLLLTGQPTARIEHTVGTTHEDINSLIESLPSANPVCGGETFGQKAGALEVVGELVPSASSDTASLDSCPSSEESGAERAEDGQIEPKKEAAL